jgi:hypothetical protein
MQTDNQKRLRRSKESERTLGRFLLEHDGPDPALAAITSSTGRVGHITDLQFDVLSRSYAAENKQVRVPVKLLAWWLKIIAIAAQHNKQPLLRIEPTNERRLPAMHIITAERHAELLDAERAWQVILSDPRFDDEAPPVDKGPEWC